MTDDTEKKSLLNEIHRLEMQKRKLPYKDATGKKIVYVRYADDFLIGVCGSHEDCERIKQELTVFISERLKLELSDEKTKITHSSENARFLGYDINVRRNNQTKRTAKGIVQRTLNQSVELLVPFEKIEQFMYQREIVIQAKDGSLIPWQRGAMAGLTDLEVVDTYNSQARGICNYYSLASNFSKLTYFVYLMEYSCLKTLAKKHKSRISAIKKMYQCGHSWGIPYETKSGKKRMMIIKFSDLKKGAVYHNADTITHHIHFNNSNALEDRLRANKCELCGNTDVPLEIHHINKLKNLSGKEQWERAMIARKRKEEAFLIGDGKGKPTGIFAATGGAENGATTAGAAITFDDMIELFYSLKSPYRKKAVWVLNEQTVKALRKVKDSNGQYIWQPSVTAGVPDTILNRPYVTSVYAPTPDAGNKAIAFGDFSYYWIADRQGRSLKRLNELFAMNGQVGFLASQRVDGKLILPEAVKTLTIKGTSTAKV